MPDPHRANTMMDCFGLGKYEGMSRKGFVDSLQHYRLRASNSLLAQRVTRNAFGFEIVVRSVLDRSKRQNLKFHP